MPRKLTKVLSTANKKREKYIDCLADPLDGRTDEEISVALEVDVEQIRMWSSDEKVTEEAHTRLMHSVGTGRGIHIIKALFRQATGGSATAARLLQDTFGMGTRKGEVSELERHLMTLTSTEVKKHLLKQLDLLQPEDLSISKDLHIRPSRNVEGIELVT